MINLLKKRRGLSIVELIIAVTLLAICTVPLLAGFTNVALMNKMTKSRIEINAVAKLVQQQMIDHIKKCDDVEYYNGIIIHTKNIKGSSGYIDINNGVVREDSTVNSNFKFNAKYNIATANPELCEYTITLFKKKGSAFVQVQKFIVTAYVK
jgi:Tfp pilus assembly protein PilE